MSHDEEAPEIPKEQEQPCQPDAGDEKPDEKPSHRESHVWLKKPRYPVIVGVVLLVFIAIIVPIAVLVPSRDKETGNKNVGQANIEPGEMESPSSTPMTMSPSSISITTTDNPTSSPTPPSTGPDSSAPSSIGLTLRPSSQPTGSPTGVPSSSPTHFPTTSPSAAPSVAPSASPTTSPTDCVQTSVLEAETECANTPSLRCNELEFTCPHGIADSLATAKDSFLDKVTLVNVSTIPDLSLLEDNSFLQLTALRTLLVSVGAFETCDALYRFTKRVGAPSSVVVLETGQTSQQNAPVRLHNLENLRCTTSDAFDPSTEYLFNSDLQGLDGLHPKALSNLQDLIVFSVSRPSFTTLPNNLFSNNPNLKAISIWQSWSLETIEEEAFANTSGVEELTLNIFNTGGDLPKVPPRLLTPMTSLKTLFLAGGEGRNWLEGNENILNDVPTVTFLKIDNYLANVLAESNGPDFIHQALPNIEMLEVRFIYATAVPVGHFQKLSNLRKARLTLSTTPTIIASDAFKDNPLLNEIEFSLTTELTFPDDIFADLDLLETIWIDDRNSKMLDTCENEFRQRLGVRNETTVRSLQSPWDTERAKFAKTNEECA